MGLSRSEIELLIRAKNDAQGAFDSLNKQVSSVTEGTGRASAGMDGLERKTKGTGIAAQATGVAVGLLAERLARGLVSGFNETIAAANRLDAGLIGLSSVATAFGKDAGRAKDAAKQLASDGLLSVGDAAAGLKNLLASGFSLPEAITLMERFKDTAAFGRQGALGFGEAIVGATQGIKNGNSIMVDNVGITKNLSQILTEAGYSATDLSKATSDANIRQALFNGLIKESAPMLGDTARFLDTAAGKQAQFSAQVEIAQQKIGKALQPALASVLTALEPFVKLIGNAAPILAPAAIGIGLMVAPILAVKAAAALGIPSLAGFTSGLVSTGAAAATASTQVGTATVALRAFSMQSGSAAVQTVAVSSALKTAAPAAAALTTSLWTANTAALALGTAFVGWQLGSLVGKIDSVSSAVARLSANMGIGLDPANQKLYETSLNMGLLDRASKAAGRAVTSVAEAGKILQNVETIRLGQFNKTVEMQKAVVAAELSLGRITQQVANERLLAIAGEERAQQVAKNRISLAASISNSEKQVQAEIKATGFTMNELLVQMRKNEDQTKKWLEQQGVSAETIKVLEDRLKSNTTAQKKSNEEAEKAAAAHQKLLESLQAVGLVTKEQVNKELAELTKMKQEALAAGIPLEAILKALAPRLSELATQAKTSNVKVDGLNLALKETMETLFKMPTALPFSTMAFDYTKFGQTVQLGNKDLILAQGAIKSLGITTQAELKAMASSTAAAWRDIVKVYGEKSPEATAAYKKMIEAQKAASGELPGFWQTQVFPAISGTIKTIGTAVEGTFAQMLLGAKSFKDGFLDIWQSIKSGVLNILNQVLQTFINSFLKGLLGALNGQQGAMGKAFAGLFGGGGGGAGGLLSGASGLFGGGSGMTTFDGLPGVNGAKGVPVKGGLGTWGGSALGAAAGFGLGFGVGGKYGTGKGVATGILGGAGTGFAFGGPIGAGIGAVGGLIGGLIGGAKNNTKDQRAAFAQELGYRSVDELFAALQEKAPDQAGELRNRALNQIGKKDTGGNQKWMDDVLKALGDAEKKASALASTVDSLGLTWEDMGQKVRSTKIDELGEALVKQTKDLVAAGYEEDRVLAKQAAGYSELYAKAIKYNEQLPASMQENIKKLAEMGLLVDENGNKVITSNEQLAASYKDLADVQKALSEATTDEEKDELTKREADLLEYIARGKKSIELFGGAIYDAVAVKGAGKAVTDLGKELGKVPGLAEDAAGGIVDAFRRIQVPKIRVPWGYEQEGGPEVPGGPRGGPGGGPGPGEPEGAAAGGVMANRPGLVIFGEGGETEVGGPASFFERIFQRLGIGEGGGLGGGAVSVVFGPGSIQVIDASGLEEAMDKKIIPKLIEAVKNNRRAARTELRAGLGLAAT